MDLFHLECFVMLAEELHFGRASERLHIGTPSLSKRISDLERELHLQLFDRSSRRVALTPGGDALLEQARRTLDDARLLRKMAVEAAAGARGRIRAAYSPGMGEIMTLMVRQLQARLPGVAMAPEQMLSMRVLDAIRRGDVSLGISRVAPTADLSSMVLATTPVSSVVMPSSHRLAKRSRVRRSDLDKETMLMPSPTLAPHPSANMPANVRYVDVVSEGELMDMVASGFGVLVVTETIVQRNPRHDLVVRPLAGPVSEQRIYLVWRTDDESPIVRAGTALARELIPEIRRLAG